ncbi:MAG: PRC-barrel domain-containing protein [Xanthobacteraceae bacterium]
MRKILFATCAITALSGLVATSSMAQTQTPSSKSQPSAQSQKSSPSAQTTTGIRQVDGAALVMTFYTANPADFRVSKLMGKTVYNLKNEDIGEIEDVIVNDGKTIKAIVVSVGGFLGVGDRNVAIDPSSLVLSEQPDGSARFMVNTTKDDLKNAPAFNLADVDKAGLKSRETTGSGNTSKK